MKMTKLTRAIVALSILAGGAIADAESSSSTHERSSTTQERFTSTHESSSATRVATNASNELGELQCKTEVISRVSSADVTVLGSRRVEDGVRVRLGVGPDRKPWGCTSFDDGHAGDVGPIRDGAHGGPHGHHHGKKQSAAHGAVGNDSAGDDPFFDSPGIYEQACLMQVESQANTLDAVVLGSDQTNKGLRVRIGVGPDRTAWHCLAQDDGSTSDVGPVKHHGGPHHGQ